MSYARGEVVAGPDLLGGHDRRPYVRLSDESHPFDDEEGLYAAVTTTRRPAAIPLADGDFVAGGLPKESYVNPWTIVTIRNADMHESEGRLGPEVVEAIADAAAGYLGAE